MILAISPCPNDTFLFEGLHRDLGSLFPNERHETLFLDIAELNALAARSDGPDVIKVSCASVPHLLKHYRLLPCGGAMGEGCGPLLLRSPGKTHLTRVALPGHLTTAHVLFRHWLAGQQESPVEAILRFDRIAPALVEATFDHGVVIHETRFTFASMGLEQAVDLGAYWESTTGSPIPLGALLVRRDRGEEFARSLVQAVRASLDEAWARPEPITPWIASHAQEIQPQVQREHIATYVTAYSRDIGVRGLDALRVLWKIAGKIAPEGWPSPDMLAAALEETAALR